MTDNLNERGGRDRTRIDVSQEWELRYWSDKFGCTHKELIETVKQSGPTVAAVSEYLGKQSSV